MGTSILLSLLACSPPRSIDGIETACEASVGLPASSTVPQLLEALDPGCADALAEPLGLRLPDTVDGSHPQDWLLAGLFTLWAERETDLDADWGHPSMPQLAQDLMDPALEGQGLDGRSPVGDGWLAYAAHAVQETQVEEMDKGYGHYSRGTLTLESELPTSLSQLGLSHPLAGAMLLLHEGSHQGSWHRPCSDPQTQGWLCDSTEDGTYGVAAFYLNQWMARHPEGADWQCRELVYFAQCERINKISEDWSVCEQLAERCG